MKSTNMLKNMGVMLVGMVGGVLVVLLLIFAFITLRKNKTVQKIVQKVWRKVFWTSFIRYVLEAYLTLCLTSSIAVHYNKWGTWESTGTSIIQSAQLFVIWTIPFFIWLFLHKNLNHLHKRKFTEKYGSLYLKIKTSHDWGVCYNMIFCLRRGCLCVIIVSL
jgi:hypothetical protein